MNLFATPPATDQDYPEQVERPGEQFIGPGMCERYLFWYLRGYHWHALSEKQYNEVAAAHATLRRADGR